MIIVSSTEPKAFHQLGALSTFPEKFGCDFLYSSPTLIAGVQRKQFPQDLISSLGTRLSEQLGKMQSLHQRLIILEGRPKFTSDRKVIASGWGKALTEQALNSILLSMQIEFGVSTIWTDNEQGTIDAVRNFFAWCEKPEHSSLTRRDGPGSRSSHRAWQEHFLQGWPGIGIKAARDILEHCGGIPLILTRDLSEIKGIGKKKSDLIRKLMAGS